MANIGIIGLGHMGLPMAVNLLKASHQVTGYDLNKSAILQWQSSGGKVGASLSDVIVNQDIVITMLQTGHQVREVCLSPSGVLALLSQDSLFIDCSTIDVLTSKELHTAFATRNILMVDAPVSGGVAGAVGASLTFMVGGSEAAVKKATPVLELMGKLIIHTGDGGSGQAAKICNNLILGVSMIAVSEAFTLANKLGLAKEKLFEVVNHSSGQCWVMSQYPPVSGLVETAPANHDYNPGFAVAMMLKDLLLGKQAAADAHVNLPMSVKAAELYQQFCEQGNENKDFSAIIKLFEALSKPRA